MSGESNTNTSQKSQWDRQDDDHHDEYEYEAYPTETHDQDLGYDQKDPDEGGDQNQDDDMEEDDQDAYE